MLNHQTVEKLHALRLTGMADAYRRQMEDATLAGLSFEERFGLLVDQHWTWRENQAMARRLRKSKLDAEPCVEDIDFRHPRGLDRPLMRTLISSQWVARHLSVLFIGSTGIGKSWLAQALAQKACRDGYTVLYRPAPKLFRDLMIARADGSLGRVLENIARTDVLVVDDFVMAPLNEQERRDFSGNLRRPVQSALHGPDQPVARDQLAPANRRSHSGRQHSRPVGAQRLSHRPVRGIHTQE
jgi:DNA replication protein DnaC